MMPFEGFTARDKYVVRHKSETRIMDDKHYPCYLSKYNDGIFKDMNYPFPRLSLTTNKYDKSKILTFESEEMAKLYLEENRMFTDIGQLDVVLRITPEEAQAHAVKREKILERAKARKLAEESGSWDEFNQEYPPDERLNFTFRPIDQTFEDSDEDFEARIMRDLESGNGDIHGL